MFKPFPMISIRAKDGTIHHISVGHITEITIYNKKTCVRVIDKPMIIPSESIEQIVELVKQAGGILLEVEDKSGTMHYVMACNIVRIDVLPKGAVMIHTWPISPRASDSMIMDVKTSIETIMQQLDALRRQ